LICTVIDWLWWLPLAVSIDERADLHL